MRTNRFSLTSVVSLLGVFSVSGTDLTKIDRRIGKEPVYQTKAPKYCMLVFGPEAKTRVWLVLDGDVLYVDRNATGDLTQPSNRCPPLKKTGDGHGQDWTQEWNVGEITEPDGTGHELKLWQAASRGESTRSCVLLLGKRRQAAGGSPELKFADRPEDAPVIHFAGPLTMYLAGQPRFVPNGTTLLYVEFGTPGLGKGTLADIRLPQRASILKKRDLYPSAEIDLPTRERGAAPIKLHIKFEPDG
jgi:hypothetical protein